MVQKQWKKSRKIFLPFLSRFKPEIFLQFSFTTLYFLLSSSLILTFPTSSRFFPFFQMKKTAVLIQKMQREFLDEGGFGSLLGNDVSVLKPVIPMVKSLIVRNHFWLKIHICYWDKVDALGWCFQQISTHLFSTIFCLASGILFLFFSKKKLWTSLSLICYLLVGFFSLSSSHY